MKETEKVLLELLRHFRYYVFTLEASKVLLKPSSSAHSKEWNKSPSELKEDWLRGNNKQSTESLIEFFSKYDKFEPTEKTKSAKQILKKEKEPPLGYTPKQSSLEAYKDAMLNRNRFRQKWLNVFGASEDSSKTIIKIKLSQIAKAEDANDGGEGVLKDEVTLELGEDFQIEGLSPDIKEMEVGIGFAGLKYYACIIIVSFQVHFLAIGSSEEYANMVQNPQQLAEIVKNALQSGGSLMMEGDSRSSWNAFQTQIEHSELSSRYWDPVNSEGAASNQESHLGVPKFKFVHGISSDSDSGNTVDESSYSRKYHLV